MPKTEFAYHVEVCRVSYGTETLTIVGAENEEDAGTLPWTKLATSYTKRGTVNTRC